MIIVDTIFFVMENANPMGTSLQSKLKKTSSIPLKPIDFASLGLFGDIREEELPELIYAPKTQLALELLGVFKSGNSKQSIAVVAQRGNSGKLYRIGDRLPGNAILDSVHSHFILINRGSRLEKLMFKEQNFIGTSDNRKIKASTEIVKSDTYEEDKERIESTVNEHRKIQENAASTNSSPGEKILQMIKTHGEKVINSPSEVFGQDSIDLVEEDSLRGYRLNSSNTMLSKTGLQSGDIIVAINGIPLGGDKSDAVVLAQALAQKRARIEIKRGTKKLFLTVPIPSS